jgi:hypothetical protein
MKRTGLRVFGRLACVGLVAGHLAGTAEAADILFPFAQVSTGKSQSATTPGIEATFQNVSPGTVRLTIANLDLGAKERLERLYFNLDPSLNPCELTFTYKDGTGDFCAPTIAVGAERFSTSNGRFDIQFAFRAGGRAGTCFGANDSVTYDLSGIPDLTAEDFDFASPKAGESAGCFAAALVQGAGTGHSTAWQEVTRVLPIPEPQPGALLAAALVIGILARRGRYSSAGG